MTIQRLNQTLKAFQFLILATSAGPWWTGYHTSAFFLMMAALTAGVVKDVWQGSYGEPQPLKRRRPITPNEHAIIFGLIGIILAIGFALIGELGESLFFVALAAFALMAWIGIRASHVPEHQEADQKP